MIKRRTLVIIALSLLVAIGTPMIAAYWLCYTESGLQWLAARVSHVGKVSIRFEGLQGRLTGPLSATALEIDTQGAHIEVRDLRADTKLRSLLLQTIHVDYVEVGRLDILLKPRPKPTEKRPLRLLPRWLRLQADSVAVDSFHLTLRNGRVLEAERIKLASSMTSDSLVAEQIALASERLEFSGSGELHAREPLELAGDIDWVFRPADQPQWAGQLSLEGDLDRLAASGQLTQPFVATVKGALSDLTHEWRIDAETGIEEFSLKPWSPNSNVQVRHIALDASANRDGFRVTGSLHPAMPATGPLDVVLTGNYADRTLRADELRIAQQGGAMVIEASGTTRFGNGPMALDFKGTWRDFGWPLDAKPVAKSARGEFQFAGQFPYRFSARGELLLPKVPAVSFSSSGELDRDALRFERLVAKTFDGELQADGELRFDTKAWRMNTRATGLNPATIDPRFPGRLNFRLAAEGVGFDPKGRWSAQLRDLSGELRSLPIGGRARASHVNGRYRIADTDLRLGAARLEVKGQYGGQHDLTWQLAVPDASQLAPDASGSLTSRGTLSGTGREPQVRASLTAEDLRYLEHHLGRLEAQADLDLADRRASHLQVSGAKLEIGGRVLHSAEIVLDGRASAHQLSVLADGDDVSLAVRTQSGYDAGTWSGEIVKLDLGLGSAALKLAAPARYAVSRDLMELGQLCLTGTSERACASGNWRRAGAWQLSADASGLPLKLLSAGSARQSEYSGVLALQAKAQQEPGQPWTGSASATFADGLFRYRRASGQMEEVRIGTGHAAFQASPQRFTGELQLDATEAASLSARGNADRTAAAAADWRKLPLSGTLNAQTRGLGFVPVLVPEIDRAAGKLSADLKFTGTLGVPEIEGSLVLEEGELDLYAVNMQLRDIGMRVNLKGTGLTLAAQARAGKGTAEVSGGLEWRNRLPFGQIKFKGENLELVNVPEAQVSVSPDLRFRIDGREIGVDGAVRVPHAFLTPADLSGAVLASSDEVLVGREPSKDEGRFEVTVGIQLVLGKDVRVDSYGLKARIEGNIATYVAPDEVSTATGELKIAEGGKYAAYTRELDIERGRLIFTGGAVSDPGVDLRASKDFPEALVGVNVRGTLRNPKLSFWSEPQLPQSQIASLIVTGGNLESFQDANSDAARPGRNELLVQGSALLANQLGEQLGVDVGDIYMESDVNDETRLVLGRYLSPRFYVSYGISLTEAINTLKLRYTINDRWTIESEAGEHRSADLEYKIEH